MERNHPPAQHWDEIYTQKTAEQMSWRQSDVTESLDRISGLATFAHCPIIDVGGGNSALVDGLLARSYVDLTVLDISAEALAGARKRLGAGAGRVKWVTANVSKWRPAGSYGLWHDRAVLHFLTDPADLKHYRNLVSHFVNLYVVISVFAPDGPEQCSGLDVRRYSEDDFAALFHPYFKLEQATRQTHRTPWGDEQRFLTGVWRRA